MLENLYGQVDRCIFCKKAKNRLRHIHGFGARKPRLMLVLVNPTYRNLSSDPKYSGPRFPFIGVRQFWKVLADGGLISKKVARDLPPRNAWTNKDTQTLQKELLEKKLFLTNIVKCCYDHGDYPDKTVIATQINILKEEIRIIKPQRIVAFGGLVYKLLTGRSIKFSEYKGWSGALLRGQISGLNIPVIPCYFPIGRGDPKKAGLMLRKLV